MDSKAVVLQGTRYPICLVLAKQQAPSGFIAVATNTPDSAYKFVAEVGAVLSGDAAKRLDLIQLLNVAGINCPRQATARETASALIKALTSGAITCYQQQVKSTIQVSDNTRSSQSRSSASSAVPSNAKKATQAPASNKGSASNTTASETPITEQECRSDPVSMLTGEEILSLTDFSLAANRPLTWRRLYRSSHCNQKTILGNGWRHDYLVQLTEHYLPPPKVGPKKKGTYWLEYHDEHGATHKFEKVKPGQSSYQLSSNLVLHYKENGKQVLVTPDDKHLTFMPGGSAWLLEKIINEKGQSTRFYYDSMERLQRIEVNKVRGCVLKYNKHGLLKTVHAYRTNEQGKLVLLEQPLASYEYDEQSNLVAATNQFAEQERYEYNAANLLIKRTRASGFSHHFEWDSYGYDAKCIKQWGDDNTYCYQFEYQGNKTTSIDSRGNQEHFEHNEQGKLIEHTDANGNITRYDYNSLGQKVAQTDALGYQTLYTYTEYGQLESVTQADGNRTQFGYNQLGQQVVVILPNGEKIKRQYSASGLLQSETQADGRIALYSYDKQGNLTQYVTPNGHVLKYTWNEQGELLAKQHNDELIRYSYDNLGRVNATINQAGLLTQYKYNEQGQLVETTAFEQSNPDNKQQQLFSYDDAGRLVSSKNGNGDTTEQHFEGLSQPHCVIQPDGSALHLTYDKERNLTAIERSDGHIYRINYDANENPTQITGFDGTEQQFKYDACNRLVAVTQSDKRHVNIKRDKLGRVISQHASLATNKHIVNNANHYSYTPEGKIARAHNEQSTIKQSFDKGGRLLSVEQIHNQSQTHKLVYSYDDYGRRQSLTLPDSTTLYYNYNSFGQLSAIQVKRADGELAKLVELGYDSQNNIKTQRFGNQVTLNQAFDVFGRLTQQQLSHPEHTLFDSCDYQYDAVNQLIAREEQGISCQNTQFEYNSLGQLIQQNLADAKSGTQAPETAKQFQWDSFGNPISQTQVQHDEAVNKQEANDAVTHSQVDADRLTHFGDSDFEYDDCGNQVRETGKGIKTHREYNAFNQLSSFNNNGTLTHYDYDPLGRRIAKQTEHGKIDYIWDNDQLIGEYQHGEYTWYINLPNQFHPVALIKQGELYYYHLDQLNTPRFVTNKNAEVVWQNHADVYGYEEPEADADFNKENSFTQPIRFQGQYFDEESGLHYNCYRYYSPKQQRFINQDPIGLVGGINHYQYAPNPVNWVDPFGLLCKEGQEKLSAMLDTLVGNGIDQTAKDKILKSAIDSAAITDPEGKLKVQKPDGVNKLNYAYTVEAMNEVDNTITIHRNIAGETKEMELTIEEFAGMHEFDGKAVNEEWATKGRIKENTARTLVTAKKKENSDKTYILKPEEKEELQQHCDARDEAIKERYKFARQTDGYNKQIPKVNEQSAKIGEKAADMAVKANYPGYERIHPDSLDDSTSVSGNFDMVYQNAEGDVIIVEAKGGKSPLGKKQIGDQDYQQGTAKYAQAITENMDKNSTANGNTDRTAASAIIEAEEDGNDIKYLHIETPITKTNDNSTVSEVKISEFDIG
ncbi:RHS repeat-associated core domain-containing protein [Pseudoalteromonas shioyasakiensis]|uniref:RHS repeat-associated core domain-containing protein n=1 Tax=Pseudoalteromonas shioyasakiensis TaxID=1190813 RepID=UPI001C3D9481|nr:RHS repeat-associated core domain-containing protein [Pseudoalteromonas shioyasakiensis]